MSNYHQSLFSLQPFRINGDVAQLARAQVWHTWGRGFESHLLHWFSQGIRVEK
jgi:hypothetical protein